MSETVSYELPEGYPKDVFPDKLLERCGKWAMPPTAFKIAANFNQTLCWMVMDDDLLVKNDKGEWTTKSGLVAVTDKQADRDMHKSPRVIVVSAGLKALEELQTNNIQIGDYARALRLTPYRIPLADGSTESQRMIVCPAGSIVASEDGMERLKTGAVRREWVETEDFVGYRYAGEGIPGLPLHPGENEDL